MAEISCFLLAPTDIREVSLRRYHDRGDGDTKCPGRFGYHNGHFYLPNEVCDANPSNLISSDDDVDKTDTRWPKKCDYCDYVFQEADHWQVFRRNLYRRADTEELTSLQDAPPGAMWWATWFPAGWGSALHQARGGGPHLILKTPGGEWDIDAKSSNGDGWERSGEPPNVTANPSIICNEFHGWLRNGKLLDA